MARMIDKQVMLNLIIDAKRTDPETGSFAEWLAEYLVQHLPTLTPPNECAKGKNAPTSGPLTLEELRLMVKPTPVWWDWVQGWVLARKGMILSWNGVYYNFEEVKGNFYRRPPEGEEET